MLNAEAKKELKELARSTQLREDMRRLEKSRHNPFLVDGKVDADRYIEFLKEYNAFINNAPKPFQRIIDRDMRL